MNKRKIIFGIKHGEDFHVIKDVSDRITNEQRLRAMTTDDLAEELALIATWDRKQVAKAQHTIGLVEFMKKWLRSEAKEV